MDLTEVAEQMARARAAGQSFIDSFTDVLEEVDQDDERALLATAGEWRSAWNREPVAQPVAAAGRVLGSLLEEHEIRNRPDATVRGEGHRAL